MNWAIDTLLNFVIYAGLFLAIIGLVMLVDTVLDWREARRELGRQCDRFLASTTPGPQGTLPSAFSQGEVGELGDRGEPIFKQ